MSKRNLGEITLEEFKQFLIGIGFAVPAKVNNSLAFHHHESGTLILISIPKQGEAIRPADRLSALVRLENARLVDDETLNQFRMGKLPKAS